MKGRLVIVAALYCLILSGRAGAQDLYTTSYLQVFDDVPPTRMLGVGIMDMGYSTQMYYNMWMAVTLRRMDAPYGFDYNVYSGEMITYLSGASSLDYDAAGEYETDFQPRVIPYFRNEDGAFVDHYYYGTYLDGVPVLWPGGAGAYGFYGPGPEVTVSYADLAIGTLSSIFSGGSMHGSPDHLKVLDDDTSESCNDSLTRDLKFQVVDSSGRRVTGTQTKETFIEQQQGYVFPFVYNSCRNENIYPSSCSTDVTGKFTDELTVGCPTVSGDCGSSVFLSRWSWCPRDRTPVTLSTNTYDIRRRSISVNGVAHYATGTQLY